MPYNITTVSGIDVTVAFNNFVGSSLTLDLSVNNGPLGLDTYEIIQNAMILNARAESNAYITQPPETHMESSFRENNITDVYVNLTHDPSYLNNITQTFELTNYIFAVLDVHLRRIQQQDITLTLDNTVLGYAVIIARIPSTQTLLIDATQQVRFGEQLLHTLNIYRYEFRVPFCLAFDTLQITL